MFLPQYRFDYDYLCLKLSKNFYDTNITKIFEISKFFQTFFEIFFICCLKKLFQYKYNKNILYIQTFLKKFSNKTIVLVRWREPGIAAAN